MHIIDSPKVYLVAKTTLTPNGLDQYLQDIGNPNWRPDPDVSDTENLIEAAGRMCYRSWESYDPDKPDATNPNVSRVRNGNEGYLGNILASAHGSVLEHASATFILRGVSRVLTHELVRHRAGMAYSQESLRYVRLDKLGVWLPKPVRENQDARETFRTVVTYLEKVQRDLADLFDIDHIKSFKTKKKLTSMFRRLAPIGLGTTIMVTGNLRAWRHIIAMRTSPAAEEEIRGVVGQIATICKQEFPNAFQDMIQDPETEAWIFEHQKV
ncbi:MAG: FAD-dependent thymidylate synthase [Deltaproteobacteria bacterium]|nr:FAD-dependent thymidylate synthase [Deltaproteobacteria bacterium]